MRNGNHNVISLILMCLFLSCSNEGARETYIRMQQWDEQLEEYPEAIADSLREFDPARLTPANRAYYGLIKTIADDKTYVPFTSDSLINDVARYYDKHLHGTNAHIRSLIYQSIVRSRMGIRDTTTYMPLNEAKALFAASKDRDLLNGYLLNFYLGQMNYSGGNHSLADTYYKESLRYASLKNKESHIFDAYTALFWNEMTRDDYERGKSYLDTVLTFTDISVKARYAIFNMESVYYDTQGDFNRALLCDKGMQELLPSVKFKEDQFRILFSISDKYKSLNRLDSAMYYGLQAIDHIVDSTYQFNYLLYENVADIALQQDNYKMADEYRRLMFKVYDGYVNAQTNNKILELEKRYDLTEAENIAFRATSRNRFFVVLSIIMLLSIALLFSLYYKQGRIAQLEKDKLSADKRAAESESKLLQVRMEEQQNIIGICSAFLSQYLEQSLKLQSFKSKFNNTNSNKEKLAEDYSTLLEVCEKDFNRKLVRMFPPQMFDNFFHSCFIDSGFLIPEYKLLLIMLSLKLDNSQIASFMNTSLYNLKSKKNYLKNKIMRNADKINDLERILALF